MGAGRIGEEPKMTDKQTKVLNWFRAYNVGALRVGDQWIWPADIRERPEVAETTWAAIRDQWTRQYHMEILPPGSEEMGRA